MSKILSTLATALTAVVIFGSSASALSPSSDTDFLTLNTVAVNKPAEKEVAPKQETVAKQEPVAPPVPPVVEYTVVEGDTLTTIAEKHNTEWTRIWSKNTDLAHQDQLNVGQKLTIPNSDEQLAVREPIAPPVAVIAPVTAVEAPVSSPSPNQASVTASAPTNTYRGSGGPNAYGYGWCTWWVKEKRPDIGGYWGNAVSWLSSATAAGYSSGSTPVAGAIAYSPSGPMGHVAYVESVSGSNITISEMGWNYTQGVLNYRTVPASTFQYIY